MPRFLFIDGVLTEVPSRRDVPRPARAFPYVRGDLPAYFSVASQRMVDGRADRREDLARTDCREVDPSEFRPTAWDASLAARFGLPHEPRRRCPSTSRTGRQGRAWSAKRSGRSPRSAGVFPGR